MIALLCLVGSVVEDGQAGPNPFPVQTPEAKAETARWIINNARWGYVTSLKDSKPQGQVLSIADSSGRPFFYLMGGAGDAFSASLTISQAALDLTATSNSCQASKLDPEDPRCAKLTVSGTMTKAMGDDIALGKAALFAKHPAMKQWPVGHGFTVYELKLTDLWMIDFYGGGGAIDTKMYYAAKPKHNVPKWPPHSGAAAAYPRLSPLPSSTAAAPPPHNATARRARWLVSHATWASIGTISVHLGGAAWANVRSVADGVGANSTGLPYFYLPTPDPTAVDIRANSHATVSVSEAALHERVDASGKACGGMDAEDPSCARLHISGTLKPLTGADKGRAEAALGSRHPLAPWLASGGAHTGGNYFTIEASSLTFLDWYGGPAKLSVKDYLAADPF